MELVNYARVGTAYTPESTTYNKVAKIHLSTAVGEFN